jgi:hypothetical protein
MFPQLKKINNESGILFFAVLMSIIIIMIFSLAVLMQSSNELNYSQQQIDQITSEQLTKGMFWNSYAQGNMANSASSVVLNNRTYNIQINELSNGVGNDQNWTAVTSYDTF